jgi:hypothetical protein
VETLVEEIRPDRCFGVCGGLKPVALLGELTLRLFLLLNVLITFCDLIVDNFDLYGESDLAWIVCKLLEQRLSFGPQQLKLFL